MIMYVFIQPEVSKLVFIIFVSKILLKAQKMTDFLFIYTAHQQIIWDGTAASLKMNGGYETRIKNV